jgi:hypothetical protein
MTRILSQIGDAEAIRLPHDLRAQVQVVAVPPSEPVPHDARGDVLLMSFGNDKIYELVERSSTSRPRVGLLARGSGRYTASKSLCWVSGRSVRASPHARCPSAHACARFGTRMRPARSRVSSWSRASRR